jgi:hypothetical protein
MTVGQKTGRNIIYREQAVCLIGGNQPLVLRAVNDEGFFDSNEWGGVINGR